MNDRNIKGLFGNWKRTQDLTWKKSKGINQKSIVQVLGISNFRGDARDNRKGFVVYGNSVVNNKSRFFGNIYGKIYQNKSYALKKAKRYMERN